MHIIGYDSHALSTLIRDIRKSPIHNVLDHYSSSQFLKNAIECRDLTRRILVALASPGDKSPVDESPCTML